MINRNLDKNIMNTMKYLINVKIQVQEKIGQSQKLSIFKVFFLNIIRVKLNLKRIKFLILLNTNQGGKKLNVKIPISSPNVVKSS